MNILESVSFKFNFRDKHLLSYQSQPISLPTEKDKILTTELELPGSTLGVPNMIRIKKIYLAAVVMV